MSISYVSKVLQDTPYVLPVDLNLLAKVNQYKQTEFYKNAGTAKKYFSELKNTDIANIEASQRFSEGYQNVTTAIQNLGAVDYSDMAVVGQLEGLGAQLYDDVTVSHIASTKRMRQYQKHLEEVKTNPKYSKYYDPQIEAYDNENYIKPYTTGGIGATYTGGTAPDPYLGNEFELAIKSLKKNLPPNVTVRNEGMGEYFINTITNEKLTKSDVISAAKPFLAPFANQMKKHAWYNYHYLSGGNYTKESGEKSVVADAETAINELNESLTYNNELLKTANATQTVEIKKIIAETEKQIKEYTDYKTKKINIFDEQWEKNREGAYFMIYEDDLLDRIGDALSYTKQSNKLTTNAKKLAEDRVSLTMLKEGYHTVYNTTTGKYDFTPIVDAQGNPLNIGGDKDKPNNSDKKNKLEYNKPIVDWAVNKEDKPTVGTMDEFDADTDKIKEEESVFLETFVKDYAEANGLTGGLFLRTDVSSSPSSGPRTTVSDILTYAKTVAGNNKQLEKEDIDWLVAQSKKYNGKDFLGGKGKHLINADAQKLFINIQKYLTDITQGKIQPDVNSGEKYSLEKLVQNVQTYNNLATNVEAREGWKKDAINRSLDNLTYQNKPLIDKDKILLGEFVEFKRILNSTNIVPKKYEKFGKFVDGYPEHHPLHTPLLTPLGENINNIYNEIGSKVEKKQKEFFVTEKDRLTPAIMYLNTENIPEGAPIYNKIRTDANLAADAKVKITDIQYIQDKKEIEKANGDKYKLNFSYTQDKGGSTKETGNKSIYVNDQIAKDFGQEDIPDHNFEAYMRFQKESKPQFAYIKKDKEELVVEYKLRNTSNEKNGNKFNIDYMYGGQKYTVFVPTEWNKTANSARQYAESMIKLYSNYNKSLPEYLSRVVTENTNYR